MLALRRYGYGACRLNLVQAKQCEAAVAGIHISTQICDIHSL